MTEPENLLSEWAALLLASLADAGVEDIVTSPGSRSTPFVAAALRDPRLRMCAVIDERAASFYALGQARVTGKPSVLLCTSGTAGAHYLPAVIEANASGLPLLVLTADRPIELMDCGAPQTIDQTKLFGDHARKFIDLGAPDATPLSLRALRRMVTQAVAAAMHPAPGAVHMNARARKPLEPAGAPVSDAGRALSTAVARVRALPVSRVSAPKEQPDDDTLAEIAERCAKAERGIIVCGPSSLQLAKAREHVFELARRTGFPLLTELPSQLRLGAAPADVVVCDGFDAFLRSPAFRRDHVADLIVLIGGTPTSTGFEQYTYAHPEVPRVVFAERGWADPASSPTHFVLGSPERSLAALNAKLEPRAGGASEWSRRFSNAAAAVRDVREAMMTEDVPLTEGRTSRAVLEALPDGSGLMLANSLPLRTIEAFGARRDVDLQVFCQRGANGIDGLVAGSVGSAKAMKRAFTLLIGDVSLLHDLTSLSLAKDLSAPFVVVVVQNGGGRIFEQLPLGAGPAGGSDPGLAELWGKTLSHVCTPHEVEFRHAAALFGLDYHRVTTEPDLRKALGAAYGQPRATLVEVVVPPNGAAQEYRRLWREVSARLEG